MRPKMMLSVLSKTPTSFAVIPRKGEPVLVLPADEEGLLITGESVVKNYHFYGGVFGNRKEKPKDEGNEFKLIAEALRRTGAANGRVGYDGKILPKFQFDLLKAELDSAKLVEASNGRFGVRGLARPKCARFARCSIGPLRLLGLRSKDFADGVTA